MNAPVKPSKLKLRKDTLRVRLDHPIAQAQLGYVVPAPAPSARDALAWRLLLYVLTHGYEGRLGTEAISKRGLLYYIDGQYRSDGENAFVSLTMGVDPAKLAQGGIDPSYPAFRLQFQGLNEDNHRAYWTLDVRYTDTPPPPPPDGGVCVAFGATCDPVADRCCNSDERCDSADDGKTYRCGLF